LPDYFIKDKISIQRVSGKLTKHFFVHLVIVAGMKTSLASRDPAKSVCKIEGSPRI
jgi:hypothetical protein